MSKPTERNYNTNFNYVEATAPLTWEGAYFLCRRGDFVTLAGQQSSKFVETIMWIVRRLSWTGIEVYYQDFIGIYGTDT